MASTHRYFRYFTYIQPIIKTPFVRTYGSMILTIVTLSVFIIFAIKPTVETILILQKTLTDQRQILDKLKQKTDNLSLGWRNYQSLDKNSKDAIQLSVPTKPDVGNLSKFLEEAANVPQASLSAIQFQSFTINSSTQSGQQSLAEIPFTYNIEGPYQSLLLVLDNLRHMSRLVSVDSMIFNKIEGGARLLLSISGKAYYLK